MITSQPVVSARRPLSRPHFEAWRCSPYPGHSSVPAPGRFAVHKWAVSQKRSSGSSGKIRKDLSQAEQVFEALLDLRPADTAVALRAAARRASPFQRKIEAGLERIDASIAAEVRKLM